MGGIRSLRQIAVSFARGREPKIENEAFRRRRGVQSAC